MSASVEQDLMRIHAMPYGTARTAAAESIARKIEAEGPKEHLAWALLDLVEAQTFAGHGDRAFVSFARLLRLWDETPELFDDQDERNLFWEFKWIASDLPEYPQISSHQAEAFLADMERRFRLAGNGTSSVRMSRFGWASRAGQPNAEEMRLAWVSGLRDEFEDCDACIIGHQVAFFTENGRWQEALELGKTQKFTCNREPTYTHHSLALASLLAGDPEFAMQSYRLALATLDSTNRDDSGPSANRFELLARGGHIERALIQLRNDYEDVLYEAASPLSRLRFLLGILAGLSANLDQGERSTGLTDSAMRTVADLHTWVRQEAEALAAEFDARNGTAYYAERVTAALDATKASARLNFEHESAVLQPASSGPATAAISADDTVASSQGQEAAIHTPTPDAPSTEKNTSAQLFDLAEALSAGANYGVASKTYAEAARGFEAEGWIERAGLSYAEAAQTAFMDNDDVAAHELFGMAIPRLRLGGAEGDTVTAVLAAWAPVAARVADPAGHLEACLEQLAQFTEFDASDLSEELAERNRVKWQRQRATLRDTIARAIAAADPTQLPSGIDIARAITEASTAGEEFAAIGLVSDAAHAFWVAGRVQRAQGRTDDALWSLESAFEGFTAAGRKSSKERAESAGDLIELLRASGQPERAGEIAEQLLG